MRSVLLSLAVGALVNDVPRASGQEPVAMQVAAPELEGVDDWVNTRPLTLKGLRGKVVVLHFWTFG